MTETREVWFMKKFDTVKEVESVFKEMLQPVPYRGHRVSPAHWWSLNCIYERDRCVGIYVWAFAKTLLPHLYCSVLKLLASLQKSWVSAHSLDTVSQVISIQKCNLLIDMVMVSRSACVNSRLITLDVNTKYWHCLSYLTASCLIRDCLLSLCLSSSKIMDYFLFSVVFCVSLYSLH